jgi:hypothetical protein
MLSDGPAAYLGSTPLHNGLGREARGLNKSLGWPVRERRRPPGLPLGISGRLALCLAITFLLPTAATARGRLAA